ncbi:MAG: SDR family NAD(P)-dependent oxidoreductase [Cellvibrionaceae bacterium]|nr:SDR family NAD(P)-dependent oxidoreductase [Cellvibrionaceae bacterium]
MSNQSVAIIGISGRFGSAGDLLSFYKKIWAGEELISHFSEEQLRQKGVDSEQLQNKNYVRSGGPLVEAECFDAEFFKYSAREAQMMDPQQRLFLECAWEAIEHAGYNVADLTIPVGVFAGASVNTYLLDNLLKRRIDVDLDFMNFVEMRLASDKDFLATRVAYKLNLTGPAFTLQSACSTSLLAVHTACQNLLNGECDMALAGAVTVLYPAMEGYTHKLGGMVSADGHCRAFSAESSGTVFGSGLGVVLLKRLDEALEDGDNILAVIKGSAVNNDGAQKPSYTAPSLDRQAEVVADALVLSEVDAESIGYVEAHGTGTPIGDPIEVAALTQAFREFTDKKQYCALGSVKSNIGHMDVASGMASLIKCILILQHGEIPPSLHCSESNPKINFRDSPFFLNTALRPFPQTQGLRRVGVTSLGVGGTNVHIILEEAPAARILPEEGEASNDAPQMVLLSAKTREALARATKGLAEHLQNEAGIALANVAYTTQVGRQAFKYRKAFICNDTEDLQNQLLDFHDESLNGEAVNVVEEKPLLHILLPGLDAQEKGVQELGTLELSQYFSLYARDGGFRQSLDVCIQAWNELCEQLNQQHYALALPASPANAADWWLQHSKNSFVPAWAVTYALLNWVLEQGVMPECIAVTGSAETAAAAVLQRLSLHSALACAALERTDFDSGRTLEALEGITRDLPPESSVPGIALLILRQDEWKRVESTGDHFSLLGHSGADEPVDPVLWERLAKKDTHTIFLCLMSLVKGPLLSDVGVNASRAIWLQVASSKSGHEPEPGAKSLQQQWPTVLSTLWQQGVEINWSRQRRRGRRIVLPTYPFAKTRFCYLDEPASTAATTSPSRVQAHSHALFSNWMASATSHTYLYESDIGLAQFPWLDEHRVYGQAIVPGSFHISAVLAAMEIQLDESPLTLSNIRFAKALFVDPNDVRKLQIVVRPDDASEQELEYKLLSSPGDQCKESNSWTLHSQGRIVKNAENVRPDCEAITPLATLQQRCRRSVSRDLFYRNGLIKGFEWRGDFRSLAELWLGEGEGLARLQYSAQLASEIGAHTIHPAILDACLQPFLLPIFEDVVSHDEKQPHIPLSIDRLVWYRRPTAQLWIHDRLRDEYTPGAKHLCVDMVIYDSRGTPVMKLDTLRALRMSREQLRAAEDALQSDRHELPQQNPTPQHHAIPDCLYRPVWQATPVPESGPQRQTGQVIVVEHGEDPWGLGGLIEQYYLERLQTEADSGSTVIRFMPGVEPADFDALARDLGEGSIIYFLGGLPRRQDYHAWQQQAMDDLTMFDNTQRDGVFALLNMTQALIRQKKNRRVALRIVTQDQYQITDTEQDLYPFGGSLIGFSKVLSREQPGMDVACIDFSSAELGCLGANRQAANRFVESLTAESGNADLPEVAWRKGLRFSKRFIRFTNLQASESTSHFRQRGVYLIIGGAGGVGVELSLLLAREYHARLVWVGRRSTSPAIEANIARVERAGGQVLYLSADACDLQQMSVVRARIQAHFGDLHGAVHSALVLRDHSIDKMSYQAYRQAFDIKARAALVLNAITREQKLDFIAWFSSENAIRGWHGLSNYVAGCSFKDNYGHYLRTRHQRPVTVFNWGFWGESGIASQASIRKLIEKQGILPMSNEEGLGVFTASVDRGDLGQLLVTRVNAHVHSQLGIDDKSEIRELRAELPDTMARLRTVLAHSQQGRSKPGDLLPWLAELHTYVHLLALALFRAWGQQVVPHGNYRRDTLMRQGQIQEKFLPLIVAMENMLVKAGYLTLEKATWTGSYNDAAEAMSTWDRDRARTALLEKHPQAGNWLKLVDVCVEHFATVCRGETRATDVLFPKGSNALVENIYRGNAVSDFFNSMLCDALECFIAERLRQGAERVSVLEFGAGTGSTSRMVLQRIAQKFGPSLSRLRYVYTDVSPHFTHLAQQQMANEYPFTEFQTFDMEKDPRQQSLEEGDFDLVFGTNVIHVAADVSATLDHLKCLLKKRGVLLLNELTAINDVWTLTFGLLDGWWRSRDPWLRIDDTPLLNIPTWKTLLSAQGLTSVSVITQAQANAGEQAPQALILAESDGFVHRPAEKSGQTASLARESANSQAAIPPTAVLQKQNDPGSLTFEQVAAAETAARFDLLLRYLKEKVAAVLKIAPQSIAADKPLGDLGMDSLIVLDFCDELSREMASRIPTTMIFDYPTLALMCEYLVEKILQWPAADAPPPPALSSGERDLSASPAWPLADLDQAAATNTSELNTPEPSPADDALDAMSAEEINRLLEAELEI